MLRYAWRVTFLGAAIFLAANAFVAPSWATDIIGGLGNFDVVNDTEDECDEFDIELEGVHVEDVYHTYTNGNYGPPTITSLPGNAGIRVVYKNPRHNTQPRAVEHYGVSLRDLSMVTAQRFQWITVYHAPPPPMPLPKIEVEILYPPTGPVLRETVVNVDDYGRSVWVIRRETTVDREVFLEELMPNDPLIQGTNQLDAEAEQLMPGMPLIHEDDPPGQGGDTKSFVLVYEVYGNKQVWQGGEWVDVQGDLITTVLTASIAVGSNCPDQFLPVFVTQPSDVSAELDGAAYFEAVVDGPAEYGEIFYQWRHEGIDMPGEDNPFLHIDPVLPEHAGTYQLVCRNDCGLVISDVARLTITTPPCEACDANCDGSINGFDVEEFVAVLSGDGSGCSPCQGDVNGDGSVNGFDIDPFVACLTGP